jgi:hypothetical protein
MDVSNRHSIAELQERQKQTKDLPVQNPFTNFRARALFRKSLRAKRLASSSPIGRVPTG